MDVWTPTTGDYGPKWEQTTGFTTFAVRDGGTVSWSVAVDSIDLVEAVDPVLQNIPAAFYGEGLSPYLDYIPMRLKSDPSYLIPVLVYIDTGTMYLVWDEGTFGSQVAESVLSFSVTAGAGGEEPTPTPTPIGGVIGLMNRPCLLVRRSDSGQVDIYGDATSDVSEVEAVCEIQQAQRGEIDGAVAESRWNVFFPAGVDVDSSDALLVDGAEYEFVGVPWRARNPRTGAESHIEATAVRVRGVETVS